MEYTWYIQIIYLVGVPDSDAYQYILVHSIYRYELGTYYWSGFHWQMANLKKSGSVTVMVSTDVEVVT